MRTARLLLLGGAALAVMIATVGSATADPGGTDSGTTAADAGQPGSVRSPAAETGSEKGPLSPRLQEIAGDKPQTAAALSTAAREAGLPKTGPGSLMRGPGGVSVEVIIRVEAISHKVAQALKAAGAQITVEASDMGSYSAYVAPKDLTAVTAVPGVIAVSEIVKGRLGDSGIHTAASMVPVAADSPPCPVTTSRANTQLKAALARANFGVDGTGIKIGVISDSYDLKSSPNTAAQNVASGNLPGTGNPCGRTTPVQVIADNLPLANGPTDEGRSMLQLAHNVAPGATLMFATGAVGGLPGFAENIRALQAAGADVIVDDYGPFDEVQFQDSNVDKAITDVTALGVTYLSSAGNSNDSFAGNDIASMELDSFSPTTCPVAVTDFGAPPPPPNACMNFAPSGPASNSAWYTIDPGQGMQFMMSYSEPLSGVTDDLDLYVVNEAENAVLASSRVDNIGTGTPTEFVLYVNQTASSVKAKLVISRTTGSGTPRIKIVLPIAGNFTDAQYTSSAGPMTIGPSSIYGHAGGTNTLSIAATDGSGPGTTPEEFSSRGPVTHYWAPFTTYAEPAAATPATVLNRPDFTATDNDCVTFDPEPLPGPDPTTCPWLFSGTSAAAPNAAGVVALLLSRNPTLTSAQVRAILIASAAPMAGGNVVSTGAGLLDANAALALAPPPPPTAPLSATYTNVKRNRTVVRWGGSVGATGYRVLVNGKTECSTLPDKSRCRVRKAWGGRALVQVIALGADADSPATTARFSRSDKPIVFGTVYFKPYSSRLDQRGTARLRRYARQLAAQGFRQVTLDGYMARNSEGGSRRYRKQLSRARAEAAGRVIRNRLYNLRVHVTITVRARGSKHPVGNENTSQGQAKNRRATVNIR